MKKILLCLGLFLMLLGCKQEDKDADFTKYKEYYNFVDETEVFAGEAKNFDLNVEYTSVPNQGGRYYVFIEEPKTAMYDVVIFIRENGISFNEQTKMMPTIGIFDETCHLIPNQINIAEGYAKGLMASGEFNEDEELYLDILVEWMNKEHTSTSRELIHIENN